MGPVAANMHSHLSRLLNVQGAQNTEITWNNGPGRMEEVETSQLHTQKEHTPIKACISRIFIQFSHEFMFYVFCFLFSLLDS